MSQKAKWDTTDSVSWSRFNSFTGTLACYSEFSRGTEPMRCMCLGDAPQELTQECVEGGSPWTSLLLAEDWVQFNPAQAQRSQTKEFQHPNQKRIVGRRASANLELLAPSQPSVSTTPVKAYHLIRPLIQVPIFPQNMLTGTPRNGALPDIWISPG